MYAAKTTGTYLNIRKEPSTSSAIVRTIDAKGSSCRVTPDTEHLDWFKIEYKGTNGYVASRYIEVTDGAPCTVNITSGVLNIRQTPSTRATIIYTMNKDESMRYLGSQNGWKCVSCNKGTGWASGEYITILA